MINEQTLRDIRDTLSKMLGDPVYPSSPRLLPEGPGVICDQCGRTWNPLKDEKPNCEPCAAAWLRIERK